MGRAQMARQLSYQEYIKKGLTYDRMQREVEQMRIKLDNLQLIDDKFGVDKNTAIVYSLDALRAMIKSHEEEIAYISNEMDETKNNLKSV